MSRIGFLIKRLTKDERDLEEGRERQAIDCPGNKEIENGSTHLVVYLLL